MLPSVSYDHPDIYPTKEDYIKAFDQFKLQSGRVIEKVNEDSVETQPIKLAGKVRRHDAELACEAVWAIVQDMAEVPKVDKAEIRRILSDFPGVGRRFEKLADGIYTDYAHHPEEIVATIEMAREQAKMDGFNGVLVVYQPHQNIRQHEVKDGYREAFVGADKIIWLPTYLTREDPNLPILSAEELAGTLVNEKDVSLAELSRGLAIAIRRYLDDGYLVVLMTAGPADEWMRRLAEGESVDELGRQE